METVRENDLQLVAYEVLGPLPNPFLFDDGTPLKTSVDWCRRRREIMQTAVDLQFGRIPPAPEYLRVELLCLGNGHRSYRVTAGTKNKQTSFLMKMILPREMPCPIIVDGDGCANYFMQPGFIETALESGIGWVLFDRTELAHDVNGEGRSQGSLYDIYPDYNFGAIGAWAWAYCRCIDALEQLKEPGIDLSWLVATGHSRGGKAAILAGSIDERFRLVNPNEACLGGGGCYRIHCEGDYLDLDRWPSETLKDIMAETAFWFGPEMSKFINHEDDLPFDAHYLKALVAPRFLLVSEAAGDLWANPVGSWQTTVAAQEVYKFLNAEDNVFWYYRAGTHFHKTFDMQMLVSVIRHCREGKKLDEGFFKLPFKPVDLIFDWKCPGQQTYYTGGVK